MNGSPLPALIAVSGLSMRYATPAGPVQALDDVSMSVAPGGSLAIVGASGCGKSTLLGILGGLEAPTAGSVRVGDRVLGTMSDQDRAAWRRTAVGFVFQTDNLQPFLTISENLGLQAELAGLPDDPRLRRELLDALGVGDLGHRYPDQLSGGQRQRVSVARALVHGPGVLLADEPTGSLDAANSGNVVELLLQSHRRHGTTLVVVTHDHAVAERMERIVELRAGRVVDCEVHA